MGLTVDSMFQPFNDFFSKKYDAGQGTPVKFRFSKFPHTFVDSDFQQPLACDSQPLALEVFSSVVDKIPLLDPDGSHVLMEEWDPISAFYSDYILGGARPLAPAFNHLLAEAISPQYRGKRSSLLDVSKTYFPSNPDPEMWWAYKTAPDVWKNHSIEIRAAGENDARLPNTSDQILRLKIDNDGMRTLLLQHLEDALPESGLPTLSRPTLVMAQPIFAAALSPGAEDPRPSVAMMEVATTAARPALTAMQFASVAASPAVASMEVAPVAIPPTADIHTNLVQQISVLPFDQRREVEVMLAQNEPTQAVESTDASISFDFCLVNIARPWLHNFLFHSRDWFIDGREKGALSKSDGQGLPAMPVGFVAVKNLRIRAPWTEQDISNLQNSVQFGPFNFDSKIVDGAITHDGIQIVGWMLQELPDLPPNSPPK
jgi:hypothetical protein